MADNALISQSFGLAREFLYQAQVHVAKALIACGLCKTTKPMDRLDRIVEEARVLAETMAKEFGRRASDDSALEERG